MDGLAECLVGENDPFKEMSEYTKLEKLVSGSDMREYLKQSNSQLMDSNVDIVMKFLSSNIDNRYGSCEELLPIVKIL